MADDNLSSAGNGCLSASASLDQKFTRRNQPLLQHVSLGHVNPHMLRFQPLLGPLLWAQALGLLAQEKPKFSGKKENGQFGPLAQAKANSSDRPLKSQVSPVPLPLAGCAKFSTEL